MRDGNIVMLALSSFFGEISGEGWFPKADVLEVTQGTVLCVDFFDHGGAGQCLAPPVPGTWTLARQDYGNGAG